MPAFVKVAAIGTLADVVPLTGENRVIAKLGLGMLSKGPHKIGLRALLDVCGLTGKEIDSYHIGFVLAPRVNAAGRMSTPDIAARLLLASDEAMADEARQLAEQLNSENLRRQQEEADIVAQARKVVETDLEVGSRSVIVVAGEGWHRGVIGIVASKLVDAFHRPAIVISIDGDVGHGSCRSIPSFDMLAALESCGDAMIKFGGHKQAAGLTIESSRIRELRARVNDYADERLQPDDLRPRIWIDGALAFRSISEQVASEMTTLAPFGAGNPRPGLSREPRRGRGRSPPDQGSPSQDGIQAGRAHPARHRLARRRARNVRDRAPLGDRPRLLAGAGHLERRALPAAVDRRLQGTRHRSRACRPALYRPASEDPASTEGTRSNGASFSRCYPVPAE